MQGKFWEYNEVDAWNTVYHMRASQKKTNAQD
jgi:hypothetical protein